MRDRSARPHRRDRLGPTGLARIPTKNAKNRGVCLRCRCWLHSKLYGFSPLIVHPPPHEFGPAGKIGANGPPVGVLSENESVDEV